MPAEVTLYNPETLGAPWGMYSHVARVRGASDTIYLAGMLASDHAGRIVGEGDLEAQAEQVFLNVATALKAETLDWHSVALFTTYLVHSSLIPRFMSYRKRRFPEFFPSGRFPPNTLLIIDRLVHESFLIEVQTIAVR
jgi:enamine deaminase RidA (YjgF/YER057c/UK114 family)